MKRRSVNKKYNELTDKEKEQLDSYFDWLINDSGMSARITKAISKRGRNWDEKTKMRVLRDLWDHDQLTLVFLETENDGRGKLLFALLDADGEVDTYLV